MAGVHLSMQLLCTLCPKNPKFSDVSHLLTHISSKSHLSHRFNIQIRAQSEIAARKQLDDFDIWYHNNNLDALLADRLSTKEQKKTSKERKQRPVKVYKKHAKKEREPAAKEVLNKTPVYRAPVPRMHLWPTEYASESNPLDEWEQATMYSTPTARRMVPGTLQNGTPAGNMIDPNISTPWRTDENDASNQKLPDSAKLKGIYWPGMNLFDSATPEMKKMRNQRKDGTLLEMMMVKSAQIEPNEVSYMPSGEFRASRNIFGPLSTETSPEKSAALSPKKRRTRKALANINVNAPRPRPSRTKKGPSMGSPTKRPVTNTRQPVSTVSAMHRQHMPTLNPLANFGYGYIATAEEDAEFNMTIGGIGRKQTFDIFCDQPEGSPARTESPLEEHGFDFSHSGLPIYASNKTHESLISPTPLPRPTSARGLGNENRNEHLDVSTQFPARRTISASSAFPAPVYYDPTFNPLYNHMYARSHSYSHHQLSSHHDHKTAAGNASTFQGNFKPFLVDPMSQIPHSSMSAVGSGKGVIGSAQDNI